MLTEAAHRLHVRSALLNSCHMLFLLAGRRSHVLTSVAIGLSYGNGWLCRRRMRLLSFLIGCLHGCCLFCWLWRDHAWKQEQAKS